MATYKLTISYDGSGFCGWQRQASEPSVQEAVETALRGIFKQEIPVTGSGRTDAGVHAVGQTASFSASGSFSTPKIPAALNFCLPRDIRVTACEEVSDGFNARKDAVKKTYHYYFYSAYAENPLLHNRALRVGPPTDVRAMADAARIFTGKHDFSGFCAAGSSAKTAVREVYDCKIEPCGLFGADCFRLVISANGFLYKMVRLITGGLFLLGAGKLTKNDLIAQLSGGFAGKNRLAAKAHGLYLYCVEY
jgi:tRNA pseudouridine38-40 synthase